jgi:hypothetical protein
MEKIPWTTYLAANNPDGVNNVLTNFGYPQAIYFEELPEAIEVLIREQGIDATRELLKQHPDYDVIIDTYINGNSKPYQNATGNETQPQTQQPIIINPPHMGQRNDFSFTLQNVVLVVMAFWLINKIISK